MRIKIVVLMALFLSVSHAKAARWWICGCGPSMAIIPDKPSDIVAVVEKLPGEPSGMATSITAESAPATPLSNTATFGLPSIDEESGGTESDEESPHIRPTMRPPAPSRRRTTFSHYHSARITLDETMELFAQLILSHTNDMIIFDAPVEDVQKHARDLISLMPIFPLRKQDIIRPPEHPLGSALHKQDYLSDIQDAFDAFEFNDFRMLPPIYIAQWIKARKSVEEMWVVLRTCKTIYTTYINAKAPLPDRAHQNFIYWYKQTCVAYAECLANAHCFGAGQIITPVSEHTESEAHLPDLPTLDYLGGGICPNKACSHSWNFEEFAFRCPLCSTELVLPPPETYLSSCRALYFLQRALDIASNMTIKMYEELQKYSLEPDAIQPSISTPSVLQPKSRKKLFHYFSS